MESDGPVGIHSSWYQREKLLIALSEQYFGNSKMANSTIRAQIMVQFNDQFSEPAKQSAKNYKKSLEGVNEKLKELASLEATALPPIPEETVRSLESTKTRLEQIQNMQDIFIRINLVDNATQEARLIREEIEKTFSQDIIQRIKIVEETVSTISSSGSSKFNSISSDAPFDLQTPSTDLTGFGSSVTSTIPGFSSGIDRVPRDMVAVIHKDEAVLPKNRAEDFRRNTSSGITIQNLDFSFNVSNGLNLGREEFRNFAFKLRDELKRLDRRVN